MFVGQISSRSTHLVPVNFTFFIPNIQGGALSLVFKRMTRSFLIPWLPSGKRLQKTVERSTIF